MSVYLVTWDLNREKLNYQQARANLINQIETFPNRKKDAGLDSVYFISTDWSAQQVYNDLAPKIDTNDRLIVTKLHSGTHQGWLDESVWSWINARL